MGGSSCSRVATCHGAFDPTAGCCEVGPRAGQCNARSLSAKTGAPDSSLLPPLCPRSGAVLPGALSCDADGDSTAVRRYGTIQEAVSAARRCADEGCLQQAFMDYSAALEMDEDSAPLCDEFGQFLLSYGQLEAAEHLFGRAALLEPMNAQYAYRHGVVLQQRKQPAKAREAFQQALRRDPRFVGALFNLGVVHRELGDHHSACDHFRKILQVNPSNHCVLALLGDSLAILGDRQGATHSLKEALRLDPSNRSAQNELRRLTQPGLQTLV